MAVGHRQLYYLHIFVFFLNEGVEYLQFHFPNSLWHLLRLEGQTLCITSQTGQCDEVVLWSYLTSQKLHLLCCSLGVSGGFNLPGIFGCS